MADAPQWVGITDTGQPLVLADCHCPCFRPGKSRLISGCATCWYCRWADFRKSVYVTLAQSVCRCPHNQVAVILGSENEVAESEGGANYV